MARQKKPHNDTAAQLRPVAKALIKKAIRIYDATKDALTEAGEQFEDLITEARAEMKKGKPPTSSRKRKGNQ